MWRAARLLHQALMGCGAPSAVGAVVLRDGAEQVTTAEQLVPGDAIRLGPGDVVPADCPPGHEPADLLAGGRSRRASTVALAALVGSQVGQTLLTGGADRDVALASIGSAAALTGAIQTPGVSGFFGCTPLGPVGWGIAATSATSATLLGAFLARTPAGDVVPRVFGDDLPRLVGAALGEMSDSRVRGRA